MISSERTLRTLSLAARGITWGLALLGLCGMANMTTACSAAPETSPAAKTAVLRGVYHSSDPGMIGILEIDDETHYRFWRNTVCTAPDAATNVEACAEVGTYANADGTLALTNGQNGRVTKFSIKVLGTTGGSGASPSGALLGQSVAVHPDIVPLLQQSGTSGGAPLITPTQALLTSAFQATPQGDDGSNETAGFDPQNVIQAGSGTIWGTCGQRSTGTWTNLLIQCDKSATQDMCGSDTPRSGLAPASIGQGFC